MQIEGRLPLMASLPAKISLLLVKAEPAGSSLSALLSYPAYIIIAKIVTVLFKTWQRALRLKITT